MVKNLPAKIGDVGLIPGAGRSPGEGNGSPLQSSCLGNPMDRGAWWAAVRVAAEESDVVSTRAAAAGCKLCLPLRACRSSFSREQKF